MLIACPVTVSNTILVLFHWCHSQVSPLQVNKRLLVFPPSSNPNVFHHLMEDPRGWEREVGKSESSHSLGWSLFSLVNRPGLSSRCFGHSLFTKRFTSSRSLLLLLTLSRIYSGWLRERVCLSNFPSSDEWGWRTVRRRRYLLCSVEVSSIHISNSYQSFQNMFNRYTVLDCDRW